MGIKIKISEIPEGYFPGLSRRRVSRDRRGKITYAVAHLYEGTPSNVGQPMCKGGYEAAGDISIWRGNIGPKGVCTVCLRRARAGLEPAPWPNEKKSWYCGSCAVEVYERRCPHCGKTKREKR